MTAPWLEGIETRNLFFTGKGGVGKTSLACASGMMLAAQGHRTLIVSTDPASNLDEVLGTALGGSPSPIPGAPNLFAMNIDPEEAAERYRDRAVGPYRGLLPEATVRSMEESLSGACTTEIAAFDEFTGLLGGAVGSEFDRIVFDTAPTGHTLRLLSLPSAWTGFLDTNTSGASCLGPLSALQKQQAEYRSSVDALKDARQTTVILVARADAASLKEAARAAEELSALAVENLRLVVNGVFAADDPTDPLASALERRGLAALLDMPARLAEIPRSDVPLVPVNVVGLAAIRTLLGTGASIPSEVGSAEFHGMELHLLVDEIEKQGHGVVMTMGKGGVGKTTVAAALAGELASRGHSVLLTTTDPAGHVQDAAPSARSNLEVQRIDPRTEVARYTSEVVSTAGAGLDDAGLALLEEDLRSPCTEEIAVFRAFAEAVAVGRRKFVVLDTAPTGHTILLLDAAEAYHRDVLRTTTEMPDSVRELLPRLRDPEFTKVLIVTLPEPTPVHEAQRLQEDLVRAGIQPYAWIVNQSLAAALPQDRVLRAKAAQESGPMAEAASLSNRVVVVPWVSDASSIRADRPLEAVV